MFGNKSFKAHFLQFKKSSILTVMYEANLEKLESTWTQLVKKSCYIFVTLAQKSSSVYNLPPVFAWYWQFVFTFF